MMFVPTRRQRTPVLAIWVLALTLAACGSSQSRFQSHMERGKQFLAAGNIDKAGIEFRNALQIKPRSAEAFYFAGRVAERRGSVREALELYEAALDARPNDSRARASLARLFVLGGATQQALAVISPGLLDHPDDPDLLAARAAARHALKDETEARADAERAVRLAPTNENALAVLSALALRAGENERAVTLLVGALEKVPASIELRQILANVYVTLGQPRLAQEQMRRIIALEPGELSPRIQLAQHLARRQELDEAQQVLEAAVRDLPHNDAVKLALVEFLTAQRSREKGERALRGFVAREPANEDLRLALGAFAQRGGATTEAIATYREVIRRDGLGPKGLAARDRIAAMEASAGHLAEASKLIAEVLDQNPRDDDALIIRSNIELARNDPGSAIVDLRSVLHDQPKSAVLHRSLARAYVARGQPALAEETLRSVLDAGTADVGVRLDLAQVLLQTDRPGQAVSFLEETVRQAPADPDVRVSLIRAYLADGDLAHARAAVADLKARYPALAEAYHLAGIIAHEEKRPEEAEHELGRALDLQPTSLDALSSLTRYSLERGHSAVAIDRLLHALEREPNNARIIDLLGGTYLETGDLARAADMLTRAVAVSPGSWLTHRGLARVKLAAGDVEGGLREYRSAYALAPTQPRVVMELAALYETQGQVDAAIACYESMYRGDAGARQIAANNLAMLLVTYKTDRASLDRALALTTGFERATEASLLDTVGWVRFKRREYRDALSALERASDRSPESKVIRYHLAMAQLKLGQIAAARANLEAALSGAGTFTGSDEARSALASLRAAPRSG